MGRVDDEHVLIQRAELERQDDVARRALLPGGEALPAPALLDGRRDEVERRGEPARGDFLGPRKSGCSGNSSAQAMSSA